MSVLGGGRGFRGAGARPAAAARGAGVDCPALPIPLESTAAGLQGFLSLLYYAKFSSGWTQDIPAQ